MLPDFQIKLRKKKFNLSNFLLACNMFNVIEGLNKLNQKGTIHDDVIFIDKFKF